MTSYLKNVRAMVVIALSLAFALSLSSAYALQAYAAEGDDAATASVRAQAVTIDDVRNEILGLSTNPMYYKASDREKVEAIDADYKSLSAEDQATLDVDTSYPDTLQPIGRVLEAALWAVWSYDKVDNSTTLPNGTYDATTTPSLSSTYSKGKSTSARNRPWSVKSVTVRGGKAMATLMVESSTYSGIWMGGITYPRTNESGNCEFANVPIDLNSTFYFAGISESMPEPIAFSLTTAIDEPEAKTGDLADATVTVGNATYTGKPLTPAVVVKDASGTTLKLNSDYTATYKDNVNAGTATVTVTGKGSYTGKQVKNFTIAKASNSIALKSKSTKANFKAKNLKKKAASISLPQASAAFGTVKWSVGAKDKKKVLSLKSGKVQVKKGAKKGTYTLKLKLSVAGTANYAAASADFAVTATVK